MPNGTHYVVEIYSLREFCSYRIQCLFPKKSIYQLGPLKPESDSLPLHKQLQHSFCGVRLCEVVSKVENVKW